MSTAILIAISFSIGFFFESIIGFGGGIIAYAILGFFIDVKTMILAGLYIGTCSSAYIIYTDYKSFDKKIYKKAILAAILGTIIGAFVFSRLDGRTLSIVLGLLLICLSIKTFFYESYNLPKIFKKKLILIGGISQGAFGIGGPFWVNALKKDFKNKSALRTTIASFFVTFNLVRVIQLSIQGQLKLNFFSQIWWTVIPIAITIYLGYKIHNKVNEKLFKKLIALMTFLAGINFLY